MQSSISPPNNGHHAPCGRSFGTIGKELIGMATRTSHHVKHPPRMNSSLCALNCESARHVQKISAFMACLRLCQVQGGIFRLVASSHLRANLHAAGPDSGTDRHRQGSRIRSKCLPHFLDSLAQNARRGSSPSRVDRGKGARFGISKKYREAVRNLHPHSDAASPGCKCIRFLRAIQIIIGLGQDLDTVGMDLGDSNQPNLRQSNGVQEAPAVCFNTLIGIRRERRQVEQSGWSKTRREAVTETRQSFQGGANVEYDAVRLAAGKPAEFHGMNSGLGPHPLSTELSSPVGLAEHPAADFLSASHVLCG